MDGARDDRRDFRSLVEAEPKRGHYRQQQQEEQEETEKEEVEQVSIYREPIDARKTHFDREDYFRKKYSDGGRKYDPHDERYYGKLRGYSHFTVVLHR